MRAAIAVRPNERIVIEDVNFGGLGDREVRIRTRACGVCHSDLSYHEGKNGPAEMFPMVYGHEAVGEVVETGSAVSRCKVGDIVVVSLFPVCGECWHCQRGESQHCETFGLVATSQGFLREDGSRALALAGIGAFAEEFQISETLAVPIRTDVPLEQVALVGCGVTTGVGAALWTAQVTPGSTVAIFGCGGVGQSVVQGARLAGAGRIFAVDPAPLKRQVAQQFGATDLIDPIAQDPVEALREATDARGVDFAFEVTGIPAVAQQVFASLRRRGIMVAVGMPPAGSDYILSGRGFFAEEKQVRGSLYGSAQSRYHLPMLIGLAESGKLDLASMVSRKIGLEDINEAFDAMRNGEVIRSVITFD
ncbi:Zn-dependent alcohol dehydrogenase [Sphingobium sp. V4]|uniref:Zn-dependent alcohol dehydrogenase n=1 Tax=Sphingobium sp. V4 TaxID=3038927 RepID=UPI002557D9BA|nr:Zn-dependent alcohol dehydrogenase [Sphingobium sp. V4]WIW89466.1 Zn-dependent alcohol dehydrogenase [Sphingobium sp. V4]